MIGYVNIFIFYLNIMSHLTVFSAVGAAASPKKIFWGKFGRNLRKIWTNLFEIWAKVIKIWVNLIRFGQNQNLVSSKTLDLLRQ